MGKYDQYKESVFTHEEMQPMIIETDMTDIVERLRIGRETCGVDMCRIREAKSGCTCAEAADEIERLREALERLAELDGFVCGRPMLGQEVINYTQFVARAALGEKE